MPQLPFVQAMVVVWLLALLGVVVAMLVGNRVGAAAGRTVLRASLAVLLVGVAGCLWWGQASGDLTTFNTRMGVEAWLQIGAFGGIILSIGYRFVGRYLDDMARAEREEASGA
jgi:hypothetical protein